MECVEGNLPTQLVREPTREGTGLCEQREGGMGDMMAGVHLKYSDHKKLQSFLFSMTNLNFQRADSCLGDC